MSATVTKSRVLSKAFQRDGARGVLSVLLQKLQRTWRRGEVWQLGRFVGMPTTIVRIDGCKFTLDAALPVNVVHLLLENNYEAPEREALKKYLDPELPVIELGACLGIVSCLTNRRLRHPEKHIVVEANPTLVPLLAQNRERNGCSFKIVHGALSYGADTVTFKVNDNILASSLNGDEQRAVVVSTVPLKLLLNETGFENVTLICDIEGAELQLVEHELDVIGERVAMIIMELHDRMVGEEPTQRMLQRLESVGFQIVSKDRDVVVMKRD
ncbi:MAG TPA: FkbM family methyltransferase [Pyrinomonadaceae bacterium]|nr:FkbM family methyltransferase [Pyrinomonadaceae bacterium]